MSSTDLALPWKQWGLRLTKLGDTLRWTALGFMLDDPPHGLYYPRLAATPRLLWGWDGHAYVGGAPYLPPEIYAYLLHAIGTQPPAGHPLRDLPSRDYQADLAPYATEDFEIGIYEAETCFTHILLTNPAASSATAPTLLVRGTFHLGDADTACEADALHWRRVSMELRAAGSTGDLQLALAGTPRFLQTAYTGSLTGLTPQGWDFNVLTDQDGNPILDENALVTLRPEDDRKATLTPLGADLFTPPTATGTNQIQGTTLWIGEPNGDWGKPWVNRIIIAPATLSWHRATPTAELGDIVLKYQSGAPMSYGPGGTIACLGLALANPFLQTAQFENPWVGKEYWLPAANWGGGDTRPILYPTDNRLTWADIAAWLTACGQDYDPTHGDLNVHTFFWQNQYQDTSMDTSPLTPGNYPLTISWRNGVH